MVRSKKDKWKARVRAAAKEVNLVATVHYINKHLKKYDVYAKLKRDAFGQLLKG